MDLQLKDKVAIVTGGSRGIGKAVARELASEGAHVAIVAREQVALEKAAAELADLGGRVVPFSADTSDDASVSRMVAKVAETFGRIDILINGAAQPGGQSAPPTMSEVTAEAFWTEMNVKILGYLRTAREVAPHLARQGGGRIVNISGLAARNTGNIVGSIRNVGVHALTKNLADELAPSGIAVVCVHPGLTRTENMAAALADKAKAQGRTVEEVEAAMLKGKLRRVLSVEEVASAITFLASPRASAINGDVVAVSGGSVGSIYY